jgi:hypothetical protein
MRDKKRLTLTHRRGGPDTAHAIANIDLIETMRTRVSQTLGALSRPELRFTHTCKVQGCKNGQTYISDRISSVETQHTKNRPRKMQNRNSAIDPSGVETASQPRRLNRFAYTRGHAHVLNTRTQMGIYVYTSEILTALMRFSGARSQRAEQVLCVGLGECSERVLVATR